MANFKYNLDLDNYIFLKEDLELAGQAYALSACTTAGRVMPDSTPKPNEDAFSIVASSDGLWVAVFDGASSQKPIPELGDTSGARFASHTLKKLFESAPLELDAQTVLSRLNQQLRAEFLGFSSVDFNDMNSLPTSTATIAHINVHTQSIEIAHVGDSFATVLYTDGSTKLLTNDLHRQFDDRVIELIHNIATQQNITPREARDDPQVKTALMKMFQTTRNRPDGTGEGIVNGDPIMNQYIHAYEVPLSNVQALLIGSDGLVPPTMDERRDTDRKSLFDLVGTGTIKTLIDHTRSVEDKDPDRWHVRYKHADDATGILIQRSSPN